MAERGRPLFSIGAVARMLDLPPATIRTWETRYALVVPERSTGGQRLYSRDQVDQLRFVREQLTGGRRPAEAHRLLSERLSRGESIVGTRLRVLLAENRLGSADLLERLLGRDAFELLLAATPDEARGAFDRLAPAVVVVDSEDGALDEVADRLRETGVKVLPLELLQQPVLRRDDAHARQQA